MTVGIAALLEQVAATISTGLLVADADRRVLWANATMRDLAASNGVSATDTALECMPFLGVLVPGERSVRHWTRADGVQRRLEVTCRRLAGDVAAEGEAGLLLYEVADVTRRRAREEQTRRSDQHLFRIEQLARAGTWEWDLENDDVQWSDDLLAAFGYPEDKELDYHEFRSLVHGEDLPLIERTLADALETCLPFTYTHRMYLADRLTQRVFQCYGEVIANESGRPVRVMGAVHDITEQRRVREELAYLADRDPLTSLPNRRAIVRHLRERQEHGVAAGALLLAGIDDFKELNELHGQAAGDDVLRALAPLLLQRTDPRGFVGRYGGDQLALLLPDGGAEEALHAGRSICDAVARHEFRCAGVPLRVGVSVGVVPLRRDADEETLLAWAGAALQQAKWGGKGRAELFDPRQPGPVPPGTGLFNRVHRALEDGHLALVAQPVLDLATRSVTSYELLLRLRDAIEPPLDAGHFLPPLERSELMQRLDRWVVAQAAAALGSERGRRLHLDVNVSLRSLTDPTFAEYVAQTLRASGVEPARLGLEVTETAAITNPDALRHLTDHLAPAGCRFLLDDFSAGLGTFVHLKRVPLSAVKIAGAFFRAPRWTATDHLLVNSVVGAARGLGMRTIAKHVEPQSSAGTLQRLGVQRGQSFHLGRPRPLTDLLAPPGGS